MLMEVDEMTGSVLLIDADSDQLNLYRSYLEAYDILVVHAMTLSEALHEAVNQRPDVVVGDLFMTAPNGQILLDVLMDETRDEAPFFLILHLEGNFKEASSYLCEERIDMLQQPIQKDVFLSKIERQMRLKRIRSTLKESEKKNSTALKYIRKIRQALKQNKELIDQEKALANNSLRQIALMVEERDQLLKTVSDLNRFYKENFDRFIDLLSSIVESKRQYHRGHAKRVAEISVFIAKSFGLPDETVRHIEVAALLHEIGQLSVPDDVVSKLPAAYSDRERDLMVYHPVKGAKLLENFSGFKEIATIIAHIHERVDGKGVPNGLRKKAIPLGSKIIAVASFFDDLLIENEKGSYDKFVEKIEENIGILFDASVVHRLRKYIQEHLIIGDEKSIAIGIFNLKPGMVLAAPIYTTKGAKLVQTGIELTETSIDQIARYSKIDPLEETVFIKG